jgi:hypothetical protein
MFNIWEILLTSALTVITGTLVYSLGQLISKFVIDPIHKQKEAIGDIADALVYYADVYSNPGIGRKEKIEEAHKRFRQLSGLLRARSYLVPSYDRMAKIKLAPLRSDIERASNGLIGVSNSVYGGPNESISRQHNDRYVNEIRESLNIPKNG